MTTSYPGAIDSLTNPTPSDPLNSATVPHAAQHANANDAIEAIQNTLGTNPQGTSSTVKDRIIAAEGAILNLNLAIDERVPGEAGSNAPTAPLPNGYVWVDTSTNAIKVWNGTTWVDPSNAGSGGPSWAVASGGTESTITDSGKSYKVHTFTGNGTLTVSTAGQVEVFAISGGAGTLNNQAGGGGGRLLRGIITLNAGANAVTVGPGGTGGGDIEQFAGRPSSISTYSTGPGPLQTGAGGSQASWNAGLTSSFNGTPTEYGRGAVASPTPNRGDGAAYPIGNGSSGIVMIRYPV